MPKCSWHSRLFNQLHLHYVCSRHLFEYIVKISFNSAYLLLLDEWSTHPRVKRMLNSNLEKCHYFYPVTFGNICRTAFNYIRFMHVYWPVRGQLALCCATAVVPTHDPVQGITAEAAAGVKSTLRAVNTGLKSVQRMVSVPVVLLLINLISYTHSLSCSLYCLY